MTPGLIERLEGAGGHTPGPWTARRMHTGGWDVFDPRGRDVVTVYGGGVEIESREANARLIAAAPRMFDYIAARASGGDAAATKIMESLNANP